MRTTSRLEELWLMSKPLLTSAGVSNRSWSDKDLHPQQRCTEFCATSSKQIKIWLPLKWNLVGFKEKHSKESWFQVNGKWLRLWTQTSALGNVILQRDCETRCWVQVEFLTPISRKGTGSDFQSTEFHQWSIWEIKWPKTPRVGYNYKLANTS